MEALPQLQPSAALVSAPHRRLLVERHALSQAATAQPSELVDTELPMPFSGVNEEAPVPMMAATVETAPPSPPAVTDSKTSSTTAGTPLLLSDAKTDTPHLQNIATIAQVTMAPSSQECSSTTTIHAASAEALPTQAAACRDYRQIPTTAISSLDARARLLAYVGAVL